jgi:hypothetical protein
MPAILSLSPSYVASFILTLLFQLKKKKIRSGRKIKKARKRQKRNEYKKQN